MKIKRNSYGIIILLFSIIISSCLPSKIKNYELVDLSLVITFEKKEESYTYYSTHFILGEDNYDSKSGTYISKAERGNIMNFFEEYSNFCSVSKNELANDILKLSNNKETIFSNSIYSFLLDETFMYIAFKGNATLKKKSFLTQKMDITYMPSLFCDPSLKIEKSRVQDIYYISQLSNIEPITKDLRHRENFILMPIDSIGFEFCTK